jgi:hypothetical protein
LTALASVQREVIDELRKRLPVEVPLHEPESWPCTGAGLICAPVRRQTELVTFDGPKDASGAFAAHCPRCDEWVDQRWSEVVHAYVLADHMAGPVDPHELAAARDEYEMERRVS